jgi:hypothetical protein
MDLSAGFSPAGLVEIAGVRRQTSHGSRNSVAIFLSLALHILDLPSVACELAIDDWQFPRRLARQSSAHIPLQM